jgi:glycosyltransferase involved in cell wall biosynthesis
MQIAIVCEAVFPESKGGLERWMVWLAESLNSKGHNVTYINSNGINEFRNGISYKCITKKNWKYLKSGKRSASQAAKFGKSLFIYLRKNDYELIYSAQAPLLSLFFIALEKFLSRKKKILIVEWLEIWSKLYWTQYSGYVIGLLGFSIQTLALRIGDAKVCFTDRVYKKLIQINHSGNVYKLPGICMDDKVELPPNFNEKNNIIFLSRLVEDKQPILAIDSVIAFKERGWKGIFYLIGTGPLESKIKRYIELKNASSFIKLLVNISDSEVRSIMRLSFVLLHTSRREGFGLSMVEAACTGVPTILINYPENASVDLEITKDLVVELPILEAIVIKLQNAYTNQNLYYEKLKNWIDYDYEKFLGYKSLIALDNIMNSYTASSPNKQNNS